MPPIAVEPGTRLVDRYRLEEPLGEGGGTSFWRAHDEVLDRPVGMRLLTGERGPAALTAARAAAGLDDGRFLRVLDANEVDGLTYVVTESVAARTLTALVADGPLRPDEAHHIALEVAEALAAAHLAGLAHLALVPDAVLRTSHGQVKVAGLAVDAAALGVSPPRDAADAASRDARGCAAVLYAALTARWPEEGGAPEAVPLQAAPREHGRLCSPRQVRPHIPAELDRIAARGLADDREREGLATPQDVATALSATTVTTRIPVVDTGDHGRPAQEFAPDRPDDQKPAGRGWAARLGWGAAMLLLAAGLALVAWQVVVGLGGADGSASPGAGSSPRATAQALKVVAAHDFDPQGDRSENPERVARAFDGNPSTEWTTKTYFDPFGLGGIKDGVGIVLDLGSVQSVGTVTVTLVGTGTDVQLRTASESGDRLTDYAEVASVTGAGRTAALRPGSPVRARYLLVWLTKLPQVGRDFRGGVADVSVQG